ncbi:MAG: TetR family transcriptional regulator [Actinobacteria bacterium]|nr:TetR family transcriptional regulator [Actinomycetota bacterium]
MARSALDVGADTRSRILDAAFEAVSAFGLARTTVEDVAHRAGLSRQTIYRYFPSKDHLILALVLREEERFLDGVRAEHAAEPDLEEASRRAILFVFSYARRHPLLDRLLATDQGSLLPYLTTRGMPLYVRAREAMAELVASRVRPADPALLEAFLDASVRSIVSYVITPSDLPPRQVARTLGRMLVVATGARGGTS